MGPIQRAVRWFLRIPTFPGGVNRRLCSTWQMGVCSSPGSIPQECRCSSSHPGAGRCNRNSGVGKFQHLVVAISLGLIRLQRCLLCANNVPANKADPTISPKSAVFICIVNSPRLEGLCMVTNDAGNWIALSARKVSRRQKVSEFSFVSLVVKGLDLATDAGSCYCFLRFSCNPARVGVRTFNREEILDCGVLKGKGLRLIWPRCWP